MTAGMIRALRGGPARLRGTPIRRRSPGGSRRSRMAPRPAGRRKDGS